MYQYLFLSVHQFINLADPLSATVLLYSYYNEMNSTEVQNPWRKLGVFGSALAPICKVCSRVSEALLLALRTLSLSFVTNNSSSDSKAFLRFIAFSCRLPNSSSYTVLSVFFDAKAWPHGHKLTSSRALRY